MKVLKEQGKNKFKFNKAKTFCNGRLCDLRCEQRRRVCIIVNTQRRMIVIVPFIAVIWNESMCRFYYFNYSRVCGSIYGHYKSSRLHKECVP